MTNKTTSEKHLADLLTVFLILLIIFTTMAYILTSTIPREQFFQLHVLGEKMRAEKYYPNNSSNIFPNTELKWYVGITNFMGSPQLIILKIKLGNLTTHAPIDRPPTPAALPVIKEYQRILLNNETWEFPFFWKIVAARNIDGRIYLTLQINDEPPIFVNNVSAVYGNPFRIIIELWTVDKDSYDYIFGWKSGSDRKIAWLQLWFNATTPQPP